MLLDDTCARILAPSAALGGFEIAGMSSSSTCRWAKAAAAEALA